MAYSNCNDMITQGAVNKDQKGPDKSVQTVEVMNILLLFQIEFLLNPCCRALNLLSLEHCQKIPLWFHIPWLHRHIFLSLLILTEHMSQDTYSLSYGNFIPDTMFSSRPLGLLYRIMIPTHSLDTPFIRPYSVREHFSTVSVNVLTSISHMRTPWYLKESDHFQTKGAHLNIIRLSTCTNIQYITGPKPA